MIILELIAPEKRSAAGVGREKTSATTLSVCLRRWLFYVWVVAVPRAFSRPPGSETCRQCIFAVPGCVYTMARQVERIFSRLPSLARQKCKLRGVCTVELVWKISWWRIGKWINFMNMMKTTKHNIKYKLKSIISIIFKTMSLLTQKNGR